MSNLRPVTRVLLLLVFGGALAGWYSWRVLNSNDHRAGSEPHAHSHGDLQPIDVDRPYPTLSVSLEQRSDGDRVLHLTTENFTFRSPVDTGPVQGLVGHGHLLVDGESIAMFYKPRYVLPDFMPGTYQLRITLNEHESHRPIRAENEMVSDTVELTVPERNNDSP